jgi:methionyl-tRNA formyltransferase
MKLVFMGTPEFAVPALKKIIESSNHKLAFVITQPDKPVGRKQILTAPPVKVIAQENGIQVYQPEKLNQDQALIQKLKETKPDLMITVAYGQIIKQEILDIAPVVNVHASLLPKYRGPAPINWCLINGDKEVGVTTMMTAKGVDTGAILMKSSILIDNYVDSVELTDTLAFIGAELLIKTLDEYDSISPEEQVDLADVSQQYSPFMNKDLGEINFASKELILKSANPRQDYFINRKVNSAKNIHNLVRGVQTWPGAYFIYKDQKISLMETDFKEISSSANPAEIIEIDKLNKSFSVQTQSGTLIIKKLKAQGKNEMPATEWLNGQRITLGDNLSS